MMQSSMALRKDGLKYENLKGKDLEDANKGAWFIKVSIAMGAFVVLCFLTECIPLPGVSFCIGLILVFTGVVSRKDVAMLYWDDACWFIMGSLMFAAAFVKTGGGQACLPDDVQETGRAQRALDHPDFFRHHHPPGGLYLRPCPGGHVPAHRHAALPEQSDPGSSRGSRTGQDVDDRHRHGL